MPWWCRAVRVRGPILPLLAIALFIATAAAVAQGGASWPRTSRHPVTPLAHPSLEARLEGLTPGANAGFEFVAFGDQRAMIGGDSQALFRAVGALALEHDRLLFAVDTGDIVDDGFYSDQFQLLAGMLGEVRSLAYLVAVGNHEVSRNRPGPARGNTARFLSSIGEPLSADRLYYGKVAGGVRFLFLDSNDLVYRDGNPTAASERRAHAQINWLVAELADPDFGASATTVVVMHHPLVQSSVKHRSESRNLWNRRFHGRQLADLLADGGVDLVLTGHTHTYERFTIVRRDGRGFHLVNLSGKPESSFLWIGAAQRRAQNIHGNEAAWLYSKGWRGLEDWTIVQEEAMTKDDANQFGLFQVDKDGGISLSTRFLGRPVPEIPVRLLWGQADSTGREVRR